MDNEAALEQMDETGDPEDEFETAEPDEEETGAPFNRSQLAAELINHEEMGKDLMREITRLQSNHGKLTTADIAELMSAKGVEIGKKYLDFDRQRRRQMARRPIQRREPVHPEYAEMHDSILRVFKAHNHGRKIVRQEGYYYGVVEAVFGVEGGANGAVAFIDGTTNAAGVSFSCFKEFVGQRSARLGGPYTVNASDTNMSQPSATSFVDELFLMRSVEATFRGFRILYAPADIATMVGLTAQTTAVVNGNALVFDDDGLYIPREMWNPLTDECELARTLATGALLQFTWNDTGAGNSSEVKTLEVCSFADLPKVGRKNFTETSGAARVLGLDGGFWWTQDQQWQSSRANGGNGIFAANVNIPGLITHAFQPIHVMGSPLPLVPTKVALDWEICVYGQGFWPAGSARRPRRRE